MNSVIIPRVFNGRKIFFDKQDNLVYLNATKTAKEFNKRLDSWQKSPQTIEYVDALQDSFPEYTNSGNGGFIVVRKGGNDKEAQGTWIHPKLIIFFARWLSPHFAVWCDLQIEEILKGELKQEISYKEKVEAELLGLGFTFDRLRLNEASKVKMMKTTYGELGLITSYLPKYSEEDLTYSLTHLLKKFEVGISAKDMNLILIEKGVLEVLERSSRDRNGVKTFKSLTEKGLEFGKNLISPHNQLETQPHYFESKFEDLLELISEEYC